MGEPLDTVVVGAGVSGLSLGVLLKKAGRAVRVLEADARAGGVVRSRRVNGFLLEDGPNGFLNREPAMADLIQALGIGDAVRPASPDARRRFLVHGGALVPVPMSPPAFFGTKLLSAGAKWRVLTEPFLARRGGAEDESMAAFFTRHIGEEATRTLVDAVQTGIFAGDIDRLSAPATFPRLVELETKHRSLLLGFLRSRGPRVETLPKGLLTFEQGLEILPQALARALGDDLRLRCPAQRIERRGDEWEVTTPQESFRARRVVLALPAAASADLLGPLASPVAQDLRDISYAPIAVVHLGFATDARPSERRGFGFLAGARERCDILGAIDVASAFPFRAPAGAALWTCMAGGVRDPKAIELSDNALVDRAMRALTTFYGPWGTPVLTEVVRWPRAIAQYNVGHLARLRRMRANLEALPGLYLIGAATEGAGLNDCVRIAKKLAGHLTFL